MKPTQLRMLLIGIGIVSLVLIVLGFAFTSIYNRETSLTSSDESQGEAPMARDSGFVTLESAPTKSLLPVPSGAPVPADQKKIIKTGSLSLVVESSQWSVTKIREIAETKQGFVESSNITETTEGVRRGYITVRVPVASFNEVFDEIKSIAQIVEVESVQGQDVTQQYIDMEARLKNLRSTEAQYLEILKKAQTVEDILKVQQLLSQVRGDIESMEAQIKHLANQTDLATISVELSEEPTVNLTLKDFRPLSIIKAAVAALVKGLVIMFNVLVALVVVGIPMILIILILVWIIWKVVTLIKGRYFNNSK